MTPIHTPGWLGPQEAERLYTLARETLPWQAREVTVFGKKVMQPRLVALLGVGYTYSGLQLEGAPVPPWLGKVLLQVAMEVGACFDSVLCNRYRDGQDSIGWHADDEPALGPDPVVASLSLGAPRRFLTRPKSGGPASEVVLGPGDLLVMPKGFQRTHQHSMPKTAKPVGERISFTFRVMNP